MKRITVILNDKELKNFQQLKNIMECRTMQEQFRGIVAIATKRLNHKRGKKND